MGPLSDILKTGEAGDRSWDHTTITSATNIPYFFVIRHSFFSFKNNPKNLHLSYKMYLDFWDCLGRVKLVLQCIAKFQRTDLIICSHSREGKPPSYSQINRVDYHPTAPKVFQNFYNKIFPDAFVQN